MFRIAALLLPAVIWLAVGLTGHADSPASEYKVLKKYQIGGDGGWDYLTMDSEARRLYIARSNRVTVLDVDTGKVAGEIPNAPGIHGVVLVPQRKQGYSSNGGDSTVMIFSLETLKETSRVKVGSRPDAIVYDPFSDRVFTFNAGSKDATAIATETGMVVGTVPLGGKPEAGVSDEKGTIYVNLENENEIVAFDAKTLAVKSRFPTAPGAKAVGLAMDRAKHRLFCTCGNQKMAILDAESGKVLGSPAIGNGTDACVFDAGLGLAFSSNRDGTLTIVEEQPAGEFKVAANVPTMQGARTMALDTKTHNIILCTAKFAPAAAGQRPTPEKDSFVVLVVGK
jgi:DNA-binding beta-propeller fold protein YncE